MESFLLLVCASLSIGPAFYSLDHIPLLSYVSLSNGPLILLARPSIHSIIFRFFLVPRFLLVRSSIHSIITRYSASLLCLIFYWGVDSIRWIIIRLFLVSHFLLACCCYSLDHIPLLLLCLILIGLLFYSLVRIPYFRSYVTVEFRHGGIPNSVMCSDHYKLKSL